MSIAIHDTIYFDKIERTNKLQTLNAIANACLNIKDKDEVKKQLQNALNIFKEPKNESSLGSGTYEGKDKQWDSKYTLSRDLGLVEESRNEIVLSKLGKKLAEGKISAKYFISVIMLNYVQIINGKIINPMYSILCEMKKDNVKEITKDQLKNITDFNLNGEDKNGYINGLFDLLKDTYYFYLKNKNTLILNTHIFNVDKLINIINIEKLNCNIDDIKEAYSKKNQKEWCDYLNKESKELNELLLEFVIKKESSSDEYIENVNLNKINIYKPNNRIIFGAPGTGKSFKLNKEIKDNKLGNQFRRVTFHPNYTYSQFVGSYKPIGKEDGTISYNFVGGPFLKTLIEALKDEKEGIPHILVIEEINRANPASVFGDVFQLLDRDSKGKSTYVINMTNEMEKYVNEELGNKKEFGNYIDELYIPNNMYIWATMNSADQGVYPMDSAFKRRWSFEYIDIDENEEKLKELGCEIIELPTEMLDSEGNRIYKKYEWNEVRKTINENLKENKINEDKLLGPFFLSEKELKESRENFDNIFKSKVLMYLYEDILKHKNIQFFKEDDERKVNTLCDIMRNYDLGKIFTFELNEYKEIEEVMENKGDEIKEPIGV
ncbi:TPA: AAA domain-containing protein [Clostridium perfringens]|uniref:McrB family protein n=1 Tax=Clostridium perfringens TaxID=1502 RepID=UPI001A3301D5|nr:AAA domain-containing protein [Clostridium perfringens]HAT4366658.1 AAA domain-containing protein [Clostridium perfringens]